MERVIRLEVQLVLRLEPRARDVVHARPECVRSRLLQTINTRCNNGGRGVKAYPVLELREKVAPETVEFARFLEPAWFLDRSSFCFANLRMMKVDFTP